jgi:hypothetical protein
MLSCFARKNSCKKGIVEVQRAKKPTVFCCHWKWPPLACHTVEERLRDRKEATIVAMLFNKRRKVCSQLLAKSKVRAIVLLFS